MYIFGGNAKKNVKLNDLWKLSLQNYKWQLIGELNNTNVIPRSGHSANIFRDFILIFGGI